MSERCTGDGFLAADGSLTVSGLPKPLSGAASSSNVDACLDHPQLSRQPVQRPY